MRKDIMARVVRDMLRNRAAVSDRKIAAAMRAAADVLKERLNKNAKELQTVTVPQVFNQVDPPPVNVMPAEVVVHQAPSPSVTNVVETPQVFVSVDLAPVAAAIERAFAAMRADSERLALMVLDALRAMPAPQVTVQPAVNNVTLPPIAPVIKVAAAVPQVTVQPAPVPERRSVPWRLTTDKNGVKRLTPEEE